MANENERDTRRMDYGTPNPEAMKETNKSSNAGESSSVKAAHGLATDDYVDTEHRKFQKGKFKDEAVHQRKDTT